LAIFMSWSASVICGPMLDRLWSARWSKEI